MDINEVTSVLKKESKKKGFQFMLATTVDGVNYVAVHGTSTEQFKYDVSCGVFKALFDSCDDTEEMWEGFFSMFSYDELYSAIRILLDTMDGIK